MTNWFSSLFRPAQSSPAPPVMASHSGGIVFSGLDDPRLLEYITNGGDAPQAFVNTAFFRCVDLISGSMGSLPFRPMRRDAAGKVVEATDHPLYDVLRWQPNAFQTANEFKTWMQLRLLVDGEAFAIIARSGRRVVALIPSEDIKWRLLSDGTPEYRGPLGVINPRDILHLRGLSWKLDQPLSRFRMAARAINLSQSAEDSAFAIFKNGINPGGFLEHPGRLSQDAAKRLKETFEERYSGADNSGKWPLLEEGLKASAFNSNAKDAQQIERSKNQVEEIARVFGVPRPLMMVDDTSWGSGIEQLAILFVRFALTTWFDVWEQRAQISLLERSERNTIWFDFDERELLRGSMKDQAEFFAKALGGPGARGWMVPDEVRELSGMGMIPGGSEMIDYGATNVPAQTATS